MRTLLLLRGAPGCGKSTWIKSNGLKQYALSADEIRMMCASPELNADGKVQISQANDATVWKMLFNLLEVRMRNGEFTVIDATNSKTAEMNKYKKLCDEYKYRIFCVDFTDIPIEIAKKRNLSRTPLKQVPEEVIDKMYSRFETQKIPSGIKMIKPDELNSIFLKTIDLNEYKKIHHIGDIHGCYTALMKYVDAEGGIKDDECYIFVGDLIDRGIENGEVMRFILSIYEKPNVFFIEGNHERWLWDWANDKVCGSKEFEFNTKKQLEDAGIDKKEVRKFYRKIGQCSHYMFAGNEILVTHGGISNLPENLTFVATQQFIKGSGTYAEAERTANAFIVNTAKNCYQIHGHRNIKGLPVKVNDRVFNLEGHVEFGGNLRCVQALDDGTFKTVEIKNDVYREQKVLANDAKSVGDVIIEFRKSKFVQEKQFGDISSFNFTRQAFYNKEWNALTTKARGLYINIPEQKIVCRSYDKFFNIGERDETELEMLQQTMKFPVTAYVKENGYLGLVAYNEMDDSLLITTKSSPEGDYAVWLREDLERQYGADTLKRIKQYSKENNCTFVFENVDMDRDPHVIDYQKNCCYLLDVIDNNITFQKLPYEKMVEVAREIGLVYKDKAYVLDSWSEFYDWYQMVLADDYTYDGKIIEGFVIEDSAGFMVKLKLTYYNFWKFMRSVAHEAIKKGYIDPRRTSALTTPTANQFYGWVKTLHDVDDPESLPKDICNLRRMFYESQK